MQVHFVIIISARNYIHQRLTDCAFKPYTLYIQALCTMPLELGSGDHRALAIINKKLCFN